MNQYINFIVPPYHKRRGSSTIFPLGIGYLVSCLSMHGIESRILDLTQKMDNIEEEITEASIESEVSQFAAVNGEQLLFWGIGPVTTASS